MTRPPVGADSPPDRTRSDATRAKAVKIPPLGYALLGLLQQNPASGYDLRKIFSGTSMRIYSDSPGAIYPALHRLAKQELIRGSVKDPSALRRREVFHVTPKGLAELKRWITLPVTAEDLVWGQQEILLRFAFSETVCGPEESVALLQSLEAALQVHIQSLHEEFKASREKMPTSGRLAFECGIRSTESSLAWTRHALATYARQRKQSR